MEYPGYGIFTHEIKNSKQNRSKKLSCSADKITTNAQIVYNHVIKPKSEGGLGFKQNNITIFGRSIGTGPATLLAS